MKKFLVSILTLIFLASAGGATVHFHYCMGELKNWSLAHTETKSDKCSNCGMSKKASAGKDCCKDQHQELKTDSFQGSANNSIKFQQLPVSVLTHSFLELPDPSTVTLAELQLVTNAPPGKIAVPLFLRHRTFRI